MANYKLYYFELRCRGEFVRLLLTYGGQKFEDIRVPMEDWSTLKSQMPMGQLPVLEINGQQMCQTTAICRYLAKECGIYGKSHLDQCKGDMLVEGVMDLWSALRPTYMAKFKDDAKEEDDNWAKFRQVYLNSFLQMYDKFLSDNHTGFFVGDSMTWADIVIAEFISVLDDCFHATVSSTHPQLKDFSRKILNLPAIKDYVATRHNTIF